MKKQTALLLEPNYKNKYPPMGLMKLAMYHRLQGFDVVFYKGELRDFTAEEFAKIAVGKLADLGHGVDWRKHVENIKLYLKKGQIESESPFDFDTRRPFVKRWLEYYRKRFLGGEFPESSKFDRVLVTTLFTFYWDITIETINYAKKMLKTDGRMLVGGVLATVLSDRLYKETGVKPYRGILNKRSLFGDKKLKCTIDELPLDYSIVEEIDYEYPARDAYFGYATRGCVNKCPFCVVPILEPEYKSLVGLKRRIEETNQRFGVQRDLLLLDNNVLASDKFGRIVDEIIECGFAAGATMVPQNPLEVTIRLLEEGWNDRAYIRKALKIIMSYAEGLPSEQSKDIFKEIEARHLESRYTALKEDVLYVCRMILPGYTKKLNRKPVVRYVDFNQGLDARLFTEERVTKLATIAIRPLRVAFDDWRLREKYVRALYLAHRHGIRHMSNYILYNFHDEPLDLYRRLSLNNELNEELNVTIYSFPMRYQPITDPEYFSNRSFVGEHWHKKELRAVQAVLNVTHGQVGKGYAFFLAAFGRTEEEFSEIMRMPEAYIKRRWDAETLGVIDRWRDDYCRLSDEERRTADDIVMSCEFHKENWKTFPGKLKNYLEHYLVQFEEVPVADPKQRNEHIRMFNEACKDIPHQAAKELLEKVKYGA